MLKHNAKWLGFPDLTVKSEVPTRWNSFLVSGRRFLEIRPQMTLTLSERNYELALLPKEWELLEAICKELEIFEHVTNLISGNTYITLNMVHPAITMITQQISPDNPLPENSNTREIIKNFRLKMLNHLNTKYQDADTISRIRAAACLDPCYFQKPAYRETEFIDNLKKCVLDVHNSTSSGDSQSQIPSTPGQEQHNITSITFKSPTPSTSKMSKCSESDEVSVVGVLHGHAKGSAERATNFYKKMVIGSDDEDSDEEADVLDDDVELKVDDEISSYIREVKRQKIDLKKKLSDDKFDLSFLSSWWKKHENKFPYLSGAVKAILCIPATSVNSERAFSTATDLITKKRNRLDPRTVEKLTFLRDNFELIP